MGDESRIEELNKKAMELVQDQRSVLEYSNELTSIWNEIDFYRPLPTRVGRSRSWSGFWHTIQSKSRSRSTSVTVRFGLNFGLS